MTDEERVYQEFLEKTIQKAQEFENDFRKLSQENQRRFWQDMAKSAAAKGLFEFLRYFMNQL